LAVYNIKKDVDDYVEESHKLYGKGTKESDEAVKKYHRDSVVSRLQSNQPVPENVLKDYPELGKPTEQKPGEVFI